jgi:hypothetical protein
MRATPGNRLPNIQPGHIAALILLLAPAPLAVAGEGVLSGYFRGNEMKSASIGEVCGNGSGPRSYRALGPVTASQSGAYNFSDTGHHYALDTQLAVYTSFDPSNPTANRVGFVEEGGLADGNISLNAGTGYTFVIQACGFDSDRRGGWSFAWSGPGSLTGPWLFATPAFTSGNFDGSDPSLPEEVVCGITDYQVSGPIRVPRTGEYFFSDSSTHFALDISLAIYAGSFNAASPQSNLLAAFDDGGSVELVAGVDYYFVVQPMCSNETGDFAYLLLGPPATFQITEGVSGAWYNPDTSGQGILLEVYPDIPLLFAAWFTWDTTQPDPDESAEVGDPNHRWLTAQGGFQDDLAELPVTLTRGGLFDNPAPVANEGAGTLSIHFKSCNEASVSYDLGSQSGAFEVTRLANDNNATCQAIANQQAVPFQAQ